LHGYIYCLFFRYINNQKPIKMNTYKSIPFSQWAVNDLPTTKINELGVRALTDVETLSIIIGKGNKDLNSVDMARLILTDINGLQNLYKISIQELTNNYRLTKATAEKLTACASIAQRINTRTDLEVFKVTSSQDAFNLLRPKISDLEHEEFWVILLNRNNKVIKPIKISQGGITGTVIDNRIILKEAILNQSSAIILAHNHPSGNTRPSEADRSVTKKIFEGAKLVDITVLDHVIIAGDRYYSFADEGILNW
jgi:DNA repair protein RadC